MVAAKRSPELESGRMPLEPALEVRSNAGSLRGNHNKGI